MHVLLDELPTARLRATRRKAPCILLGDRAMHRVAACVHTDLALMEEPAHEIISLASGAFSLEVSYILQ